MAMIGTAQVHSLETAWQGQLQSGEHQFIVDGPESLDDPDTGPAAMICFVELHSLAL